MVCSLFVKILEDDVEDVGIPACRVTLNSVLDVLQIKSVSILRQIMDGVITYLRQLEPVGHVVSGEDNSLRSGTASSHSLFA